MYIVYIIRLLSFLKFCSVHGLWGVGLTHSASFHNIFGNTCIVSLLVGKEANIEFIYIYAHSIILCQYFGNYKDIWNAIQYISDRVKLNKTN